jgi:hypothetical protein
LNEAHFHTQTEQKLTFAISIQASVARLRAATKQALQLLQDNYPEFVAKQVRSLV